MDKGADNTGPLSVQTVSADGTAPKRRMATPSAAYTAYVQLREANRRRDARFGDIAGIYAGLPPTPPSEMERNGQADMPNVNTKQFQAKCNTYTATWTAINSQGDGYADVVARHDDPMEAERRSKVQTEEFNDAIRLWDADDDDSFENGSQYVLESAARDTQMGLYGIGVSFFRDSIDFRFQMIPTRRVLIPDGSRISMNNCSAMFIEDSLSVTDLYGMIGKDGWNKAAILKNLYDHVELRNKDGAQYTYAQFINDIRDNDTWITSELQPIRIVHGFIKEFDGTISHVTFTDLYGQSTTKDKKNAEGDFIYEKVKVAKRWQQVIVPFADNAGPECDWHGVKGFGDLIFDGCHLNNLMFSRAAIGGFMKNMMMFRGMSESDAQKMDQITFTPFGMMAPGLEFEPVKFDADIDGALAIFGAGTQVMSENTRISPQNEKTTTGEQPTATQVTADRADRAQFTTLQIAIYRAVGLDVLFSEMYRRIAQPASKYPEKWGGGMVAKRFRERCAKRGIPEADLLKVKCVRANRNVGSGDMALDLMKGKELLAIATPGKGQQNARYEIACALKGPDMAMAFVEREEAPPGQDAAILTMENNLIQVGQIPVAYGWQDQEAHVTSHLTLMAEAAEVVPKLMEVGITPQSLEPAKKLNNLLAAGIGHVDQHVALMKEPPRTTGAPTIYEKFIAMTEKDLNNLRQLNDSLAEDIQKADVAAQPQQSPEMVKAQADIQMAVMKTEAEIARKDKAALSKLGNQATQVQFKTEAKTADHEAALALKADAAAQDLGIKAAKDAMDLQTEAQRQQQELAAQAAKDALAIEAAKQKATMKPKKPARK